MSDITMCMNKSCPLKKLCYRITAKVNPLRQSYADFKYKEGCDNFIPNDAYKEIKK